MSKNEKFSLLRALAVVAWADGEITNSELNVLKNLYRKLNLSQDEIRQLQPYLRAPVSKQEQTALFKDLTAQMGSKKNRKEALAIVEEMAHADKKLKPQERELLDHLRNLLDNSTVTRRSFGKLKSFLKNTLFKPAREKNPEMVHYFKSTVLCHIEILAQQSGKKIALDEDQLYFLCLLGTLLASVAEVDEKFEESEKKALKKVLAERFEFNNQEWRLLFEVLETQAKQGFDFDEVIREFNRLTTYNDRLHFVDCFFAIGAADGDLSYEETEEIRRITKAMRVPHKYFIERKMKTLEALRAS